MRRRDLLAGFGASPLVPPLLRFRQDDPAAAEAWRFSVSGEGRWSLARGRETAIAGATIRIELRGQAPFALADLEGVHRFRAGPRRARDQLLLVGRHDGLEISARFDDGVRPKLGVAVRGLDTPRDLVAVHLTGGLRLTQSTAWLNGYQSWSGCQVVALATDARATGHWQLALMGDGARGTGDGLAMAFGEDDGAAGEFRIDGRALDAAANFGRRAVGADFAPASCSLTILPGNDPLEALGRDAAARVGPLRAAPLPAGWCSWYELFERVTEDDVVANLEAAQRHFDPRACRIFQIDDGFQRSAGDWETNAKFPHGHAWLTERIRSAGFTPGLWLAPFAVTAASGIPTLHPEWLLLNDEGAPLRLDVQPHWGGQAFALDAARREVQDWLRELARHAVNTWGYEYLKLDFLHYGAQGGRPERGASGAEALRAGLRALREGAGRAFLVGCGAPLQQSLGLFDGMRIGGDVSAGWSGVQPGAIAALQRAHLHGRAWQNDPDALVVREPLTLDEARAWTSVVALSGQMTLASDRLDRLGADRIALLQRALPVAAARGRALDLGTIAPKSAPALLLGERRWIALGERWRFAAGDEVGRGHPNFDDSAWQEIEVGVPWERAGHSGLDGYAWYRTRFTAPARAPEGAITLALGSIDDVDETFVNGARVGATGAFPPRYDAQWQAFRRYAVPARAIRWGEENVVAVRVYDGGGGGGMWRLTRESPPAQVLCRAREDWWTLALVNWEDAPRRLRADLSAAGVRGGVAAYDVWGESRAADASGSISADVAPHSALVLGLRRPRRFPFVIGTTRHVVQGAVDVAEERWDPRTRRLGGRSVMLDGRPYALTVALPPGFRARECQASVACTMTAEPRGRALRLDLAGTRDDVTWEVQF